MTSPLDIEIVMHYHTGPGQYRDGDFSAPAVKKSMDRFFADGLIERHRDSKQGEAPIYQITDRGSAYVLSLCEVPLPVKKWVTPWPPRESE